MGMNIGEAMQALRDNKKVRRGAWSADLKIDHLYLVDASRFVVNRPPLSPAFDGEEVFYAAHIDAFWKVPDGLVSAGENYVRVWSPEHEDLFATDWFVVS